MAVDVESAGQLRPVSARGSFIYDRRFRAILFQLLAFAGVAAFAAWIVLNTISNLKRLRIASGFDFFNERAGFDILLRLIPYTNDDTFFRAFLVGLVNTLVVAIIGIVIASVLGFAIGIARLSTNWILSRIATVYVETLRNVPLLLQLLFWYEAVLHLLPPPAEGYDLPLGMKLSVRGLYLPRPLGGDGILWTGIALAVAVVAAIALRVWARRRQTATGQNFPVLRVTLLLVIGLPVLVFIASGAPVTFELPQASRYNYTGGVPIIPEMAALLLGLSLYTAAFISEVVRAGILSVPHGQTEAAYSLGLPARPTLRLVVIPQAFRVIVPPLTNQYLNLTKNSSLAVAIGYPDLVGVFKNTVLNQTGHALEVIFITMLVYLILSIATATFMNWFNNRIAIAER